LYLRENTRNVKCRKCDWKGWRW